MTIAEFADRERVKIIRDSCGYPIIAGWPRKAKWPEERSHIYEDDDRLGVALMMPSVRQLNNALKKLPVVAGDFELKQCGDTEANLLFDPNNRESSKLALRLIRVKKIRILSDAQREQVERLKESRQASRQRGFR